MNARVSSSKTPMAHPPCSNPLLRSSSVAPPFPCITPSTVTCVMVVSLMSSSFLSRWSYSFNHTGARIYRLHSRVTTRRACRQPPSLAAVCSRIAWAMVSQSARSTPCPAPSIVSSFAPGISLARAFPCSSGNIGSAVPWLTSVGAAIDEIGSDGTSPSGDHGVVMGGGDVTRALDVAADEVSPRHLVKGTHAPRKHALVGHQVLDHRPSVRPIHLS